MPWVMHLNNMRFANIETLVPVCWAETRQELVDFELSERVPAYLEPKGLNQFWGKTHAPGGSLEWYNQPWEHDTKHFVEQTQSPLLYVPPISVLKRDMLPKTRFERALVT